MNRYGDKNVSCPDMEMSLWDVRKKNSLGRSVLRNAFTLSPSTILPNTLKMSLDGCLDAHRDELEKMSKIETEKVLIGSSWGGAVALHAMEQGLWDGPTIFLAPAYGTAVRKFHSSAAADAFLDAKFAAMSAKLSAESKQHCLIVHGSEDDTVDIADSRKLAAATGIELLEIQGGDHRLNDAMLEEQEGGSPARLHDLVLRVTARA
mmetsp:Transcript_40050/g.95077  ORF Transcript_40050/g.95077 Transcript_40050/m.95077 type:complete len:206 (-) Transcript_40050:250-867(-)